MPGLLQRFRSFNRRPRHARGQHGQLMTKIEHRHREMLDAGLIQGKGMHRANAHGEQRKRISYHSYPSVESPACRYKTITRTRLGPTRRKRPIRQSGVGAYLSSSSTSVGRCRVNRCSRRIRSPRSSRRSSSRRDRTRSSLMLCKLIR